MLSTSKKYQDQLMINVVSKMDSSQARAIANRKRRRESSSTSTSTLSSSSPERQAVYVDLKKFRKTVIEYITNPAKDIRWRSIIRILKILVDDLKEKFAKEFSDESDSSSSIDATERSSFQILLKVQERITQASEVELTEEKLTEEEKMAVSLIFGSFCRSRIKQDFRIGVRMRDILREDIDANVFKEGRFMYY